MTDDCTRKSITQVTSLPFFPWQQTKKLHNHKHYFPKIYNENDSDSGNDSDNVSDTFLNHNPI